MHSNGLSPCCKVNQQEEQRVLPVSKEQISCNHYFCLQPWASGVWKTPLAAQMNSQASDPEKKVPLSADCTAFWKSGQIQESFILWVLNWHKGVSNASVCICQSERTAAASLWVAPAVAPPFKTHTMRTPLSKEIDESLISNLLSEWPARSLTMSSQQKRFGILGLKHFLNQVSPQPPPSSQLCYFHIEVHANSPEEREPVIGEHEQKIPLNHSGNSGSVM